MEGAVNLWKDLGLPELRLRNPWYGYNLGNWGDDEALEADLAVKGEYFQTGAKQKGDRRPTQKD